MKNTRTSVICHGVPPHTASLMGVLRAIYKKRSLTFDKPNEEVLTPTKKQACAQKIKDVEAVVVALKEKHGIKYSVEQLNAWAHMIQTGKHVSTEVPPALP